MSDCAEDAPMQPLAAVAAPALTPAPAAARTDEPLVADDAAPPASAPPPAAAPMAKEGDGDDDEDDDDDDDDAPLAKPAPKATLAKATPKPKTKATPAQAKGTPQAENKGAERASTRERKQVEVFKVEAPKSASKDEGIGAGKGTKLGDIPNVAFMITQKRNADDVVVALHTLLFRRKGEQLERKRNLLAFNGFSYARPTEGACPPALSLLEAERGKTAERVSRLPVATINEVLDLCQLPRGSGDAGHKDAKAARLAAWLEAPSGETVKTKGVDLASAAAAKKGKEARRRGRLAAAKERKRAKAERAKAKRAKEEAAKAKKRAKKEKEAAKAAKAAAAAGGGKKAAKEDAPSSSSSGSESESSSSESGDEEDEAATSGDEGPAAPAAAPAAAPTPAKKASKKRNAPEPASDKKANKDKKNVKKAAPPPEEDDDDDDDDEPTPPPPEKKKQKKAAAAPTPKKTPAKVKTPAKAKTPVKAAAAAAAAPAAAASPPPAPGALDDAELRAAALAVLRGPGVDPEAFSIKQLMATLSGRYPGADLSSRKKLVKEVALSWASSLPAAGA